MNNPPDVDPHTDDEVLSGESEVDVEASRHVYAYVAGPIAHPDLEEKERIAKLVKARVLQTGVDTRQAARDIYREEDERKVAEARVRIQAMYDEGVVFFSRDVIKDLVRQFDGLEDGTTNPDQRIHLQGLDGVKFEYSVDTGKVYPYLQPEGYDLLICKPHLGYKTFQHSMRDAQYDVSTALLPFRINYDLERRDHTTQKISPQIKTMSYEDTKTGFREARREWEASAHYNDLQVLLEAVAVPRGIQKIVAFACSALSLPQNEGLKRASPSRVQIQHALILALQKFISQNEGAFPDSEPVCFAQDIAYTDVDKQVLDEFGITVLDDPRGFLEVDDTSVVISIAPDIPVMQIIADIARPAMIITSRITGDPEDATAGVTDPESSRVLKMIREEYIEIGLPAYGDPNYFDAALIYLRKN